MNEAADNVTDPETDMSLGQRRRLVDWASSGKKVPSDFHMQALGSGSDFTVFMDHLGIPSVNLGFAGEDEFTGTYHSIYDDFDWYTRFEDTDFAYERALAQLGGLLMMRLADALVIPYQFTNQAETIAGYVAELKKLAADTRASTKARNDEVEGGVYRALKDPKKIMVAPAIESLPPYFDWAPLEQAADDLSSAADRYDKAVGRTRGTPPAGLNCQSMLTERSVLDPAGLPQ